VAGFVLYIYFGGIENLGLVFGGFWWFLVEKIEIDLVDLYFNNSNKTIETTQTKLSKQQDARYY
jgi:hypothetical protein